MSQNIIIETVDLTKVYSQMSKPAVNQLNLEVAQGAIFGLLGPNGAGKTTTAGMLTTRIIPTSGAAHVAGIDVLTHPSLAKQMMGIVSQQNTLDRALTVKENLYFHGLLFGMGKQEAGQEAARLLEEFQLANWQDKSVFALSGGMAQRLMVARAIMHRPAVLFMDEPTTGLDPQSRLVLWDILQELNNEGQTIFLTTHYMEEAEKLCGRVAIMDHGIIIANDTPSNLKKSIGIDTVVRLEIKNDIDKMKNNIAQYLPQIISTRSQQNTLELQISKTDNLLPKIVNASEAIGVEITNVTISDPTLETVFITLTGRELRE
ncbi:MAG: ATP-binding cassette domain-containing protein [Firmicutes bacterium]|nr:ATP-binding cassette domain-containing protein [Bacillota bacterium]